MSGKANVPTFDPEQILRTLNDHEVDFVLIGAMAAVLRGYPGFTFDLDVIPRPTLDNFERLSRALRQLNAVVRAPDAPHGLRFAHTGRSLMSMSVANLSTQFGDLDINQSPTGISDFEVWHRNADEVDVNGVVVLVAALSDIIISKESAGRPKDLAQLPLLRQTQEAINGQTGRSSEKSAPEGGMDFA